METDPATASEANVNPLLSAYDPAAILAGIIGGVSAGLVVAVVLVRGGWLREDDD